MFCGFGRSLVLLLGMVAAGVAPAAAASDSSGVGRVLGVRLVGPVSPVMAGALEQAIAKAERGAYAALLVQLDTPGGLETSMRTMVQKLLASPVPVIVWISPSGARAASAGVFVTMAADVAAMAPGTNIGAATPVNMQGPMDSTLARKATSDAAAFARTVAAQRRRNAAWAEDAVRRAVAASETEAVALDVVDLVAATEAELLAACDGREWRRGADVRQLDTAGRTVDWIEPGFRLRLLSILADPNVAYILLMLGFYGLLFELQNPGAILPGVVGGICMILAFFALSTLPVNYAGIALLVLATVFFLAEIKVQSHGLLGAGGVLSLVLGTVFLFEGDGVRVSWGVLIGATLATTAFFTWIIGYGLKAQRRSVTTGAQGMVGARGVVLESLAPGGRVRIGDEVWNARSDAPIDVARNVIVIGVEGLTLIVKPIAKEA